MFLHAQHCHSTEAPRTQRKSDSYKNMTGAESHHITLFISNTEPESAQMSNTE